MLSNATQVLASHFSEIFLLSRRPQAFAEKINAKGYSLDWQDRKSASSSVAQIKAVASFDLMVSWIHNEGVWLIPSLECLLKKGARSIRVHGSATGNSEDGVKTDPPAMAGVIRQNAVLGCVKEANNFRWLTHEEISAGVMHLFSRPEERSFIVGELP